MKATIRKTGILFLAVAALASCSKNDDKENVGKEYGRYLKMSIDGAKWETDGSFDIKFVERGLGVDDHSGEYHLLLSAMQSGDRETFQISLRLPADKIDNPIGSYPVASDATQSGMMVGTAEINYYNKAASGVIFSSRTDPQGSPHVGTLTITEFEKGDGAFAQRQINWLKGTFSVTLKGTEQGHKTGEIIEITGGEFEMPNALHHIQL
jgi:hypothetical protein